MKRISFLVVFILAIGFAAPGSYAEKFPPDTQRVSFIGELKVIERDKDGQALILQIEEEVGSSSKESAMSDNAHDSRTFRIAREGKGLELFQKPEGRIKITGTVKEEGDRKILYVEEYEEVADQKSDKSLDSQKQNSSPSKNQKSTSPKQPADTQKPGEFPQPGETKEKIQEYPVQPDQSASSSSYFGSEYSYDQKDQYEDALEEKLSEWEEKWDRLEDRMEERADQAEKEREHAKEEGREKFENIRDEIQEKLDDLSDTDSAGWRAYQQAIHERLLELETAYNALEQSSQNVYEHE